MRTPQAIDEIDPLPSHVGLSKREHAEVDAQLGRVLARYYGQSPALRIVGELAAKCVAFDRAINATAPDADSGETLEFIARGAAPRAVTITNNGKEPVTVTFPSRLSITYDAASLVMPAGIANDGQANDCCWRDDGGGYGASFYSPSKPEAPKAEEPKPGADDWIAWHGGDCPVARDVMVDLRFANGIENTSRKVPGHQWYWGEVGQSARGFSIAAYRVVQS